MLNLDLTSESAGTDVVTAGYRCPCGCNPATTYHRGDQVAVEGCCCGNEFAVGPHATTDIRIAEGYELRTDAFVAPWGERVDVAWSIGPSTHEGAGEGAIHDHGHGHLDADASDVTATVIDPVCGMTVDPETARAGDLHLRYGETDYFFCGKGCKLEFGDDPERYLDPSHIPSM